MRRLETGKPESGVDSSLYESVDMDTELVAEALGDLHVR
jgi:hypothetical protein